MIVGALARRLLLLFAALAAALVAWHFGHRAFNAWFLGFGNAVLQLAAPGTASKLSLDASSGSLDSFTFTVGYMPLATFAAFALATPLARADLRRLLLRGALALHGYLALRIYLYAGVEIGRHVRDCADPLHDDFWHRRDLLHDVLANVTAVLDETDLYQIPTVLLWLALSWRRAAWERLFPRRAAATEFPAEHPSAPEDAARGRART